VAGGASAAARLRRLDEQAGIVLLERGAYISYANCGLPYYVGGAITDKEELTLQTPESFFQRFRVDVRVLSEAVSIDPASKTVAVKNLADGASYQESYDALVLSPGAEPVVPPIPGVKSPGVFTLRTIPDTLRIREFIEEKHPRKAVVVGGGAIGMEMAENLHEAGLQVTVVELMDHVIAPIDFDMAADVHSYVRGKGIRLLLNTGVKGISAEEDHLTVQAGEETLQADMVIMSVGVRPESGLAKAAGLALSPKGAILTDEHMRTSDPNIYAVGDAVQVKNFVSGQPAFLPLAGPANKQGRIAADNICGIPSVFKGSQGALVLKLFDMTVAATGLNEAALKSSNIAYDKVYAFGYSHASYYPGATNQTI
jgi:NADPH-dependent 2,4-dienoyl-CoA reductase/sulfur reductase-like enzyme